MTRDEFISGTVFKFEESDSDSYHYDGTGIAGDVPYHLVSIGDNAITIEINEEVQNILYSTLDKVG
jgi:hypothetical protein